MQHESEVKLSRGFSAKARQIRSLCMQHESEVKMSRGADMTTNVARFSAFISEGHSNSTLSIQEKTLAGKRAKLICFDPFNYC